MNHESEITTFTKKLWKSNISRNSEKFANLIKDDKIFDTYFNEEYIAKLTDKSKSFISIIIKLALLYTIIMLSLFASIYIGNKEFQILGYSFKNLAMYKEFLLFLATVISPISVVLNAYNSYLRSIINECIKRKANNNDVCKFYSYKYLDNFFEGWSSSKAIEGNRLHGITNFLTVLLGIVVLILFLTLMIVSFLIQIIVIYDVINNPSSSYYVNLFVVIFAIISILFSWIVTIIQLPLPEIDYSNLYKLDKIKKGNPTQYEETLSKIAFESSKKEARFLIVFYTFIYITIFSIIAIFFYPESLDNRIIFIGRAVIGAFIVIFFSNTILDQVFRKARRWFFKKYPDDSTQRLVMYQRMNKYFWILKILIPLILTTLYTGYIFSK